jgi:hypothetical protein
MSPFFQSPGRQARIACPCVEPYISSLFRQPLVSLATWIVVGLGALEVVAQVRRVCRVDQPAAKVGCWSMTMGPGFWRRDPLRAAVLLRRGGDPGYEALAGDGVAAIGGYAHRLVFAPGPPGPQRGLLRLGGAGFLPGDQAAGGVGEDHLARGGEAMGVALGPRYLELLKGWRRTSRLVCRFLCRAANS